MHVVVCGGGVIGASAAFFLSERGTQVTVIERCGVACAASGKSGGFLALDWNDHSPLSALARRSFALHGELAGRLDADWGYRRVETLSVAASARRALADRRFTDLPDWVGDGTALQGRLGTAETTAQVHPGLFTGALMDAAQNNGARLVIGSVEGIALSPDGGTATGVVASGETIAADAVVIAMGPWSVVAAEWLPLPAVYGLKGQSLIFRPQSPASAHAIFADVETGDGEVLSPEIYPRPDGTIYVCGLSSEEPLPADPAHVAPEAGRSARLRAIAGTVAPGLHEAELVAEQACYRPVTRDGLPLIGPVSGINGAYVATGHSVWGILNAPATGEALAELILDGRSRIDLSAFDPARPAR